MSNLFTLKGFDQFAAKLKTLPVVVRKEVGGETLEAVRHWADLSRRMAPKDQGRLVNAIAYSKTGELSSQLTCNALQAPYMEWGTKTYVHVPAELSAYASQFIGKGVKGARFALQKALYAWMDRVGIPVEFQWVTYIRIVTRGVKPHPFFFPPKPIVQKEFISNVKRIIETEH